MNPKKYLLLLFFSFTALTTSRAQFLEILLENFLIDGFWYTLVESPDEPQWYETTYASYPYDFRGSGLYLPTNLEGDKTRFNVNLHFQSDEDNLFGSFTQIKFSPISLFTIEANRLQYFDTEKANDAENINITAFSLLYNRLRHHEIHAWWGIGGVFLDATENDASVSFNMGFNYFFQDPISLYGEAQIMELNNEVGSILQARLQLHLRRFVVYGGYHYADLGNMSIGSWTIGGSVYF